MARVTATEVKEIMDGCTTTDAIVDTFILAATEVVDETFSDNTELTDALLKEIERYLTAHFIASTVFKSTQEETVGKAQVRYTGRFGYGLDLTPYGQIVRQLDVSGKIAQKMKPTASIRAVKSFDD